MTMVDAIALTIVTWAGLRDFRNAPIGAIKMAGLDKGRTEED